MMDCNYTCKQYLHIAEAFTYGNIEDANKLLKKLNILRAVAKNVPDALSFFSFEVKLADSKAKRYYIKK